MALSPKEVALWMQFLPSDIERALTALLTNPTFGTGSSAAKFVMSNGTVTTIATDSQGTPFQMADGSISYVATS
jgi:hypothetical protein